VMRKMPDLTAMEKAMRNLPDFERRKELVRSAGEIFQFPPFYFQAAGSDPLTILKVLGYLTDTGNVPEALRIAHLIGSAVINGESGNRA
jgi:uncharacterized protein